MKIHGSAEDYLETIVMLGEEKEYVRSVDIAARLNVTKAAVSVMMKRLRENGLITMDEESLISLTPEGEVIARRVYDRHRVLSSFLEKLGIDALTAREDACKIEHHISDATFEAICRQMNK